MLLTYWTQQYDTKSHMSRGLSDTMTEQCSNISPTHRSQNILKTKWCCHRVILQEHTLRDKSWSLWNILIFLETKLCGKRELEWRMKRNNKNICKGLTQNGIELRNGIQSQANTACTRLNGQRRPANTSKKEQNRQQDIVRRNSFYSSPGYVVTFLLANTIQP